MTVGRRDDVEAEGSLHSKRMENKDGRGSSFRDSKSSPGGLALFRLFLSPSLFLSLPLSLSLSLPLSIQTVVRIILGADVPVGIV